MVGMKRFRLAFALPAVLAVAVAVSLGATRASAGKNDKVIVVTYCQLDASEARNYAPTVVLLDDGNDIKQAA